MISYSQGGEDAVLEGLLQRLEWVTNHRIRPLSYIEVGGFHPVIDSNLFHLYTERGWRGTIFEPQTTFNSAFAEKREGDYLVNMAVSSVPGDAKFIVFSDGDSSNTINAEFAARKEQAQGTPIAITRVVECVTLKQAIAIHQERFTEEIGVISIDAEGEDLAIIEAFDFSNRPLFFLIEDEPKLAFTGQSPITRQMRAHDFVPVAATVMTTVYIDNRHPFSKWLEKIGTNERTETE